MLRIVVAFFTIAVTGAFDVAVAQNYPFCIMGCDFGGAGYCGFDSYAQCQAAASGRDAWCAANPAFQKSRALQPASYGRKKS